MRSADQSLTVEIGEGPAPGVEQLGVQLVERGRVITRLRRTVTLAVQHRTGESVAVLVQRRALQGHRGDALDVRFATAHRDDRGLFEIATAEKHQLAGGFGHRLPSLEAFAGIGTRLLQRRAVLEDVHLGFAEELRCQSLGHLLRRRRERRRQSAQPHRRVIGVLVQGCGRVGMIVLVAGDGAATSQQQSQQGCNQATFHEFTFISGRKSFLTSSSIRYHFIGHGSIRPAHAFPPFARICFWSTLPSSEISYTSTSPVPISSS